MPEGPIARRPFLVVVRGSDDSLHRTWIKQGVARRWDLLVDWYGSRPDRPDDLADFTHYGGTTKFPSIKEIDKTWPGYLQSYEAVWFVDGDIGVESEDINSMFRYFLFLWPLARPAFAFIRIIPRPRTLCAPSIVRFALRQLRRDHGANFLAVQSAEMPGHVR